MLCDELKVYVPQDGPWGLEPEEGGKLVEEETCYLKSEADEAIAELKAENERLKKCEVWMKQHFYCEEVIACESAKNRRLKRALYKACANWSHFAVAFFSSYATKEKWHKMERKCLAKMEEYR